MDTETGIVKAVSDASLAGWRGRLARVVARPVARRTPFTEAQVVTFFALALLAYSVLRTVRPLIEAARHRSA